MSGTHGLIPHQAGYHYVTLEEDYVLMFQRSADAWYERAEKSEERQKEHAARRAHAVAKAYISSVLEQLSDKQFKSGKPEKEIWVFLSFPEIENRIHGGVKMRTLKDAMKEMIEDKYVEKLPNPDRRFKNLIYHMNFKQYRLELQLLPQRLGDSANLHDGKNESANTHDDSANLHDDDANLHSDPCKSAPKNNIRDNKEETKNNESTFPTVSQSPTASSDDEDAHALSSPSCSLCSEQEDIQPCRECGTRLCFEHRRDFPDETEPTHILCVECLRQHNRAMVETPSANTELVSAIAPANGKAEPLIASATEPDKPKRTKKASSKPALPIEEVALRKEVQTWVDKERGYSLRGRAPKEQIFAEAAATETLAHMLYVRKVEGNVQEGCEWADLVYVRTYCAKQDKYWSKPENRARLGSYAVLQQFNVALALRQTEVPQNMTSLHVVGGRQETPLQRRNREMREKYENPVAKREAVTHGA